jgi:peptidoglycan/LPS O-acetylase OafA/YrhL
MTLLVGAAALLAVGAGVTLVLGWSTDDPALVWASLLASGLAALLLVAVARSSPPDEE